MELYFLQIGLPTLKQNFLIHINELIQIKLTKGDDYNKLFTKIREYFTYKNEEWKKAAEDWIALQLEEYKDDLSVFEAVICDEDNQYAIFDLKSAL